MKIELCKKTTKIYGDVYYFVKVDGEMLSATWTTDRDKVEQSFLETIEKANIYPEDKYETLKEVES